jgi:hypothetical protein
MATPCHTRMSRHAFRVALTLNVPRMSSAARARSMHIARTSQARTHIYVNLEKEEHLMGLFSVQIKAGRVKRVQLECMQRADGGKKTATAYETFS